MLTSYHDCMSNTVVWELRITDHQLLSLEGLKYQLIKWSFRFIELVLRWGAA